jgi:hypothetical protein
MMAMKNRLPPPSQLSVPQRQGRRLC